MRVVGTIRAPQHPRRPPTSNRLKQSVDRYVITNGAICSVAMNSTGGDPPDDASSLAGIATSGVRQRYQVIHPAALNSGGSIQFMVVTVGRQREGSGLSPGHFPLGHIPRTFPRMDNSPSLFTWWRTFPPSTTTMRQSTIFSDLPLMCTN